MRSIVPYLVVTLLCYGTSSNALGEAIVDSDDSQTAQSSSTPTEAKRDGPPLARWNDNPLNRRIANFFEIDRSEVRRARQLLMLSAGSITRYGVDLLAVKQAEAKEPVLRVRTGLSQLSRNAQAGVELVVKW